MNQQRIIAISSIAAVIIVGIVVFVVRGTLNKQVPADINNSQAQIPMSTLKLSSSAFENDGQIPSEYTCQGKNISPPLAISGVPQTAKSLVLIFDDPDAPAGIWDHWILWNISSTMTEIATDSVPAGAIRGKNSFGKLEYGGPCPPTGTHRYKFILVALPEMLALPEGTSKSDLLNEIKDKVLDQYILTATYKKS